MEVPPFAENCQTLFGPMTGINRQEGYEYTARKISFKNGWWVIFGK